MRGSMSMTINRKTFYDSTKFFGAGRECDDLEMAVSVKFRCSHPPQAFGFIKKCIDGQDNFEIRFNSDKEECQVLIFPEEIDLNPSVEDLENLKDLETLEDWAEKENDEWEALNELL